MTPHVVVVGGGHNGLVAAVRLARSGCRVSVIEQGSEPGGCIWTERHHTGVLVERGAFEHGGVFAQAHDLGLDDPALGPAALTYRAHPLIAGAVFSDGQRRLFHTDLDATVAGLGADGPGYRRLARLADHLFDVLGTFGTPPTPTRLAATLAPLPGGDELFRLLLSPAETALRQWITDPHTTATMALHASHAQVPAFAPGSGLFSLLLPASHRGPAVRPEGGSRALTDALVAALESAGGSVHTGSAVVGLATDHSRGAPRRHGAELPPEPSSPPGRVGAFGGAFSIAGPHKPGRRARWSGGARVELADGTSVTADAVVSAIGLPRTAQLVREQSPRLQSASRGLHSGHFNVSELTVTLITERPVDLGLPDPDAVWYAVAEIDDVRRGFGEVIAGQLPSSPWAMVAQVGQPAGVSGGAVWLSSVVPLRRADGAWTPQRERAAAERVIDHVSAVLGVDLRAGLVDLAVSGPQTWASRIGGDGNPNHLDNTIDQLMGWRAPGHADMRTELPWLYLAGAGQHPGGGLSGASGSAAAAAVLSRAPGWSDRMRHEAHSLYLGARGYLTMRRETR